MSDDSVTILEPRALRTDELERISAVAGVPRAFIERAIEADLPVILADGDDEALRAGLAARGLATAHLQARSESWGLVRNLLAFCAIAGGVGGVFRLLTPGPISALMDLSGILMLLGLIGLIPATLAALRARDDTRSRSALVTRARQLRAEQEASIPDGRPGLLLRRATALRALVVQAGLADNVTADLLTDLGDLQRELPRLAEAGVGASAALDRLAPDAPGREALEERLYDLEETWDRIEQELDALDAALALRQMDGAMDSPGERLQARTRAAVAALRETRLG